MSTPSDYRIVPFFVLRMAGFPVELLDDVRDPGLVTLLDALAEAERATAVAVDGIAAIHDRQVRGILRRARRRELLEIDVPPQFAAPARDYERALAAEQEVRVQAERSLEASLDRSRERLLRMAADERFREMLLLSGNESLARVADEATEPTDRRLRRTAQTLAGYLQRVTMKNDTISFFGPTAWGRIDATHAVPVTVVFETPPRLERTVYFEQWACAAMFERMLADDEAAALMPVEAADDLDIEGHRALLRATGRSLPLTPDEEQLARRCLRGPAPPEPPAIAASLIDRGILVRRLPVSQNGYETLCRIVASWPDGVGAKRRWSEALDDVERKRAAVAAATGVEARRLAIADLDRAFREMGVAERSNTRGLYANRQPINEDCRRGVTEAVIGGPLVEQLTSDLAPWYELWRDLVGAYARGLLDALREVWRPLAAAGSPSLATFVRAAESAGIPLGRTGGIAIPRELEGAIQRAWDAQIGGRARLGEVVLEPDDFAFVRRSFPLRHIRAALPAPDVQVCARDARDLEQGRFTTVLSEVHGPTALWGRGIFWSCPDPARFAELSRGNPAPRIEYAAQALFSGTHTLHQEPFWVPGWTFSGAIRVAGKPAVRSAAVKVELEDDDLVARGPDGALLGSLIDTVRITQSVHRLQLLGTGPHAPRLRVGRVVVQRRSWLVPVSPDLQHRLDGRFGLAQLAALRDLRREYDLPDEVFVRPVLASRTAPHKDLKPIFVDFGSPLFLEMLCGMARHYARLRISEALPSSRECWLSDESGHYSCELRMLALPPSP